jgi:ABC-type glycerol-3-phosphate transport system substrate-binding protein
MLAAAILLAFPAVGAFCGGSADAKAAPAKPKADLYAGDKVTIKVMVFGSTEEYKTMLGILKDAHPEIAKKVDFEIVLGGAGDFDVAQKFRLALAANDNMPDMIRLNYTQVPEFAVSDVLMDIGGNIEPIKDTIIPGVLEVMKYDGKFIAYPYEVKSKIWYYRSDIYAECGVDPAAVKTVDDFIAAGKKIQAKYPNKYIENYSVPASQYDLMMQLSGNGGRFCDEKGNYNIASDPNVRKAFETIKKLKDSGVAANIADFSPDWQKSLADGTIVSQLIGNWFKKHIPNWAPDQAGKWALALWPEEIRVGSEAGAGVFVVPKASKNKELAADILTKLSFDEAVLKQLFDKQYRLPLLKKAVTDPYYLAPNKYFGETMAPVDYKAMNLMKVYPYTPAASQEIKIVVQYLGDYLAGKASLDEALQKAEKDLKNQIGNPFKR